MTRVAFTYPGSTEPAIVDLSLSVNEGEFLAILGPSGSGKSTLLRLAAGLETPSSGEVRLDGNNVGSLRPRDRCIGFVFQDSTVYDNLQVYENVALPMKARHIVTDEITRRATDVLRYVGLYELRFRRAGSLSGGERQRLAIARILGWQPRMLCFDEPLTNVDTIIRPELIDLIRHTHMRQRSVTLYVTHAAREALSLADRLLVLRNGKSLQFGRTEEVYESPMNIDVLGLLSDGPLARIEVLDYIPGVPTGVYFIGPRRNSYRSNDGVACWPSEERTFLAIRPDDIRVSDSEEGCFVCGRVIANQFEGSRCLVECETDIGHLFVWNDRRMATGVLLQLAISKGGLLMFGELSGKLYGRVHLTPV